MRVNDWIRWEVGDWGKGCQGGEGHGVKHNWTIILTKLSFICVGLSKKWFTIISQIITFTHGHQCRRTAGATVARSTPDRKVIRSNRVWFIFCRKVVSNFPSFLIFGDATSTPWAPWTLRNAFVSFLMCVDMKSITKINYWGVLNFIHLPKDIITWF